MRTAGTGLGRCVGDPLAKQRVSRLGVDANTDESSGGRRRFGLGCGGTVHFAFGQIGRAGEEGLEPAEAGKEDREDEPDETQCKSSCTCHVVHADEPQHEGGDHGEHTDARDDRLRHVFLSDAWVPVETGVCDRPLPGAQTTIGGDSSG